MKRRDLLRIGGGAFVGVTLGGCLGSGGGGNGGPTTTSTRDGTTTEPEPSTSPPTSTDGGVEWPVDPTPFESIAVGDRAAVDFPDNNRPIAVSLWNAVDEERTLRLVVTTPDDAPGLRREVTFPADGVLALSLEQPEDYTVSVVSLGSLSVPLARFDCNQTNYNVRLGRSALSFEFVSTEIACPDPELGTVVVDSEAGDCGSADRASVSFVDGSVVVDGRMKTPDPCHDVVLRTADLDADGTLVLVLEADARDEGCVDCVGEVPYRVDAGFGNDYPREVVVRHASSGGTREVARVRRGAAQ